MTTEAHRERIWKELAAVARPDSRFHWDFSSFIADFDGSDACAERVRELPAYQAGGAVFITPDNSTEALRAQVMADGRPILMTTYGIGRGFLLLDSTVVPAIDRRYAATLDGMDRFARPVTLAELSDGPKIALLVTGGSAVSANGVRFGKGHGYFDLEWAMLSEIGLVDDYSQVADVVHDCQVVDETLVGEDHDVAVDWIITPTRTIEVPDCGRALGRVRWELLEGSPLAHIPPIKELQAAPTSS
ncbi:MAG: 5-formyltetrahydrofolate cyclo-ligase [Pseudonocardiales bacterium]|nr:5-formyltetrahydrofolate cyclo-ligase [Pseudonocardiales bacterium]